MSMISEQIDKLEGLKEAIEQKKKNGDIDYLEQYFAKRIIDGAIDTIRTLSEKLHTANMERSSRYYNGGWIPCSERMPEESGKYYIVTAFEGKRMHVTFAKWQAKSKHFDMTGTRAYWRCIAWMPLPEPYREEEHEETD